MMEIVGDLIESPTPSATTLNICIFEDLTIVSLILKILQTLYHFNVLLEQHAASTTSRSL